MSKDLEHYLEKGFDFKTAEYFYKGKRKIIKVVVNPNYILTLTFDNGENKQFDVSSYIKLDTIFEFLFDINNFNRVYIDDENNLAWDKEPKIDSRVVWSNKVDISGDVCYIDGISV